MKYSIILFLLFLPTQLEACLSALSQRSTFFKVLPDVLEDEPLVALVRVVHERQIVVLFRKTQNKPENSIVNTDVVFPKAVINVEVIKAIRGTVVGDRFDVVVFLDSCSGKTDVKTGSEWYLAGALHDGVFSGSWSGWERAKKSGI